MVTKLDECFRQIEAVLKELITSAIKSDIYDMQRKNCSLKANPNYEQTRNKQGCISLDISRMDSENDLH